MSNTAKVTGRVIVADQVSISGRVYPKEVLKKALDEYAEKIQGKTLPLTSSTDLGPIPAENIFGGVEISLDEEGVVAVASIDVDKAPPDVSALLNSPQEVFLTPAGIGSVGEDGVVNDYQIRSVVISPVNGWEGQRPIMVSMEVVDNEDS